MDIKYNNKTANVLLPTSSSSRLVMLDMVRCFAMVMMIQGHVISDLTLPSSIHPGEFPWDLWNFFRGITAPLFLTVSGIVQVFANKRNEDGIVSPQIVDKRIRMAFFLIALGYLLVFPAKRIYHLPFIDSSTWTAFFQINILQLIGVSLLINAILFKYTKSNKSFGLFALILGIISFGLAPIVLSNNMFSILPNFITPYFSMDMGSIFTVFPFAGFMLLGAAFGSLLQSVESSRVSKKLLQYSAITAVSLLILSFPVYYLIESLDLRFVDMLKGNSGYSILRLGVVFVIIAIATIIFPKFEKLSKYFSVFGRKSLFVYVIHLVIIYGTPWSSSFSQVFQRSLPLEITITFAIATIIISFGVAWYYEQSVKVYPGSKFLYKYSIGTAIAFLLLV